MVKIYRNLINGKWLSSEEFIIVNNKYKNEPYAKVAKANEGTITSAITSAYETFHNNELTVTERYTILMKAAEIFKERKEELAFTICQEVGKTIKDARNEVTRGIQTFIAAAEEGKQITGRGLPIEASEGNENKMAFTIRVPVGVITAITPFNFPFNLTAHKIAPAIAAGNTIVLKPAEKAPITAMKMGEILQEAGLPNGYLNIINGYGNETGKVLLSDERIGMYTFTGSPTVGKLIKQQSGIRKVTLELGNNSPNVIHHDVEDLERAIKLTVSRGYSNAGQACISVQKIYVHQDIYTEVLKQSKKIAESYIVGNPENAETDVGPMIGEEEAKRAESWIKEAVSEGAEIITGGTREGAFIKPTIITNVHEEMKVMCEEIFAPVISIVPYEDINDVFHVLNQSKFGLQAGIFTSNIHLAMKAAQQLQYGGININDVSTFRADTLPYGGVKNSGIGKEGPRSTIEEMTDEKVITMEI